MFNPLVIRHNMQPINAMGDYGHVGEILGGYETLRDYFFQQFGTGLQDLMDQITVPRATAAAPEQPPVYHLHFPNVRSVERDNVQLLADQIGHHLMFLARAKGQYNVRA
jgi:predicted alpha/beta-fold hydrolase